VIMSTAAAALISNNIRRSSAGVGWADSLNANRRTRGLADNGTRDDSSSLSFDSSRR
jgi:hypothetical protein